MHFTVFSLTFFQMSDDRFYSWSVCASGFYLIFEFIFCISGLNVIVYSSSMSAVVWSKFLNGIKLLRTSSSDVVDYSHNSAAFIWLMPFFAWLLYTFLQKLCKEMIGCKIYFLASSSLKQMPIRTWAHARCWRAIPVRCASIYCSV